MAGPRVSARAVEGTLALLSPAAYGAWSCSTPVPDPVSEWTGRGLAVVGVLAGYGYYRWRYSRR